MCIDGACVAMDAHVPDGGVIPTDSGLACANPCASTCCESDDRCYLDTCIPDLGPCTVNDDCASDSYCAADGTCVPYGVPPERVRNDECVQEIDIETITPAVQCSFVDPPAGDPYPGANQLRGTPLVADFDFDGDPATLRPSIVFSTTGGSPVGGREVLRIIDGASCTLQYNVYLGVQNASTVALGDLDGDGRAEIVANAEGTARAWRYEPTSDSFVEHWTAASCAGGVRTPHAGAGVQGYSPSLHDMTDDGRTEVIVGGSIYDSDGCLLASLGTDQFDRLPVVADVDEDGEMEIVSSRGIYRYAAGEIELESYFAGTTTAGAFLFAGVGDLGEYPLESFGGEDRAEIIVVGDGNVRVETIEGTRLLSATLPSGRGGPPTVSDFDGDGRAEFAAAAHTEYSIFDLDCLAGGDAARCGGVARTDGRLWSAVVDENSSGVTGSSVFDFNADGRAEVVYHDECFLRIFDGTDGAVLYSYPRYSLTWFEMPVIADVDGDFHTEIVVGAYDDWSGSCPANDPYLPGVAFTPNHGVYVLRDERDRWAASRPIWNQHAYSVTHVGDRGVIPRTSEVAINWRTAGLNNFRQNTQGDLEALGVADLTASVRGVTPLECRDGVATVRARVCNRGRLPLGGGLVVALREGAFDGPELCRTTIDAPIDTGTCVDIACSAPAPEAAVDIYVVPDPDGLIEECHEANSWGRLENVLCVILE
jgi:hypothetical protein